MYSNYGMTSSFPQNTRNSISNYPMMNHVPVSSMPASNNDDRIIAGGFLGPFILGGITGGLLAPAFYPRPYYPNYYYPYPYYGPYYR